MQFPVACLLELEMKIMYKYNTLLSLRYKKIHDYKITSL
jgi:hypothetical protein